MMRRGDGKWVLPGVRIESRETFARRNLILLRDRLIAWITPFFPWCYAGPLLLGGKTLTLPKLAVPLLVASALPTLRWSAALRFPMLVWSAYLLWLAVGLLRRPTLGGAWHLGEEVMFLVLFAALLTQPPADRTAWWRRLRWVAASVAAWTVALRLLGVPERVPAPPWATTLTWSLVGMPTMASALLALVLVETIAARRWAWALVMGAGLVSVGEVGGLLAGLLGAVAVAPGSPRQRWAVAIAGSLVAAVLLTTTAVTVDNRVARGRSNCAIGPSGTALERVAEMWVLPRVYIWQIGLRVAVEHPWFGVGLGDFGRSPLGGYVETYKREKQAADRASSLSGEALREALRQLPWFMYRELPWFMYDCPTYPTLSVTAYSDLLRIAAESGVPAMMLWILGWVGVLRYCRRSPLAVALVVTFLARGLTDVVYTHAAFFPVAAVAIAFASRETGEVPQPNLSQTTS